MKFVINWVIGKVSAHIKSSHRDIIVACILLGLVVLAWTLDSVLNPVIISTDLNMAATIAQKDLTVGLYPRDNLFAHEELYRFYTPSYRWIVAQVWQLGGSFEAGLTLLVPVVLSLYLLAMFVLLRQVTGSNFVSLLLTVVSAHYHNTMGAGVWGVGGSAEMMPRTLFMPVIPVVILLFLHILKQPTWLTGSAIGLILGLATNLHPVSGFHLFILLMAWLVIFQWRTLQGLLTAFVFGLTTVIGAWPVSANYVQNAGHATDEQVSFEIFSRIVAERYSLYFFPGTVEWPLFNLEFTRPLLEALVWMYLGLALVGIGIYFWGQHRWPRLVKWGWLVGGLISVAYAYMLVLFETTLLFVIVAIYMIYRFWRGNYFRLETWLLTLMGLVILYAFVGYYLLSLVWQTFALLPLTSLLIEYARAARFVYISIYLLAGIAGATWLKDANPYIRAVSGSRPYLAPLLTFVGLLIFALVLFGPLAAVTPDYFPLPTRNLLAAENRIAQPISKPADAELYLWAQTHTASASLFYGCFGPETMTYFRHKAQRSITHNWKDLAYNVHTRVTLLPAYERFRELEAACRDFHSAIAAAHALQADYILVSSQEAAEFLQEACFANERYAVFSMRPDNCNND